MKVSKIITLVLTLHVGIISLLFFQPGCTTTNSSCGSLCRETHAAKIRSNFDTCEQPTVVAQDSFADDDDFFADDYNAGFTVENVATFPEKQKLRLPPTRPSWDMNTDEETFETSVAQSSATPAQAAQQQPATRKSYKVKKGDSLWLISKRNGVSLNELLAANPTLNKKSVLRINQELSIPPKASNSTKPSVRSASTGNYIVKRGDTLSGIAVRYKVSVDSLRRANNMTNDVIYAGKELTIPGVDAKTIAATPRPSVRQSLASGGEGSYKVKSGDSLSIIAMRYGVTVADLMKWNNISDARKLRAGQFLKVSEDDTGSKAKAYTASRSSREELETFMPAIEEDSSADEAFYDPLDDDALFSSAEEVSFVSSGK